MRTSTGVVSKTAITAPGLSTPPYLSYRGKLASAGDTLIAILPDSPKSTVTIWGATATGPFQDWNSLATIPNVNGEPLVDSERLKSGVLSVFVRQGGPFGTRKVQVWEFGLSF
jgi:hypothetical protein